MHLRLQPRQLYEMVMAYWYQYPMCADEKYLDRFGMYIDRESIKNAVRDFNKLLKDNHEPIEITNEAIVPKAPNEKHIPYLHDSYEHNECYAKILGLDKVIGEITFSKVLRNPQDAVRKHSDLILETIANDEDVGYNITDLKKIKKMNLMHVMHRISTGKDEHA